MRLKFDNCMFSNCIYYHFFAEKTVFSVRVAILAKAILNLNHISTRIHQKQKTEF